MKEKYLRDIPNLSAANAEWKFEIGGFYTATRPYTAITHTEHSFETGAVFQVVAKHKEGWWKALCNNNEGFVHERFLTRTENKHETPPGLKNGNVELYQTSPADKISMISPQVKAKKFSSTGDELENQRIDESNEAFPRKEKNPSRKTSIVEEGTSSVEEDLQDKATLNGKIQSWVESGWTPQGLDEMNPKYKNKFMKTNIEKVDDSLLETVWNPQDLDSLNPKFKDNIMKRNGITQEGRKKNNSPIKKLKKKISRSHRERSQSLTQLSNPNDVILETRIEGTEEWREQSATNEVCESADVTGSHECDSNETSCNLTNQEVASQSLADGDQVELENNDDKQMINNRSSPCLISKSPAEINLKKLKNDEAPQIAVSPIMPKKTSSEEDDATHYCARFSYEASEKGEISFSQGEKMKVIRKSQNGWWLVVIGEEKGWAPSNFLVPVSFSRSRKNGVSGKYHDPTQNELSRAIRHIKQSSGCRKCSRLFSSSGDTAVSPNEIYRKDSSTPPRLSPSEAIAQTFRGSSPQEVFFTPDTTSRSFASDLYYCDSARSFDSDSSGSSASDICPSCLSRSVSSSPKSFKLNVNNEMRRQTPSPSVDSTSMTASTSDMYQCDPECIAAHVNDEQEILDVTSKEVVEVLYQDKRGYSFVRVPSKYGWVPTTCIKRQDSPNA